MPPTQRGIARRNPQGPLGRVSPFTVAHPGWAAEYWLGASLPAAEVLINQVESCRGAPLIQAFRQEQTRTRANHSSSCLGFLSPGGAFVVAQLNRASWSLCYCKPLSWLCVWGGGTLHMPICLSSLFSSFYYH